jgi:hypothetical protein
VQDGNGRRQWRRIGAATEENGGGDEGERAWIWWLNLERTDIWEGAVYEERVKRVL